MSLGGWAMLVINAPKIVESLRTDNDCNLTRGQLLRDVILCYAKYSISPSQYARNRLFVLPYEDKKKRCDQINKQNIKNRQWKRKYYSNWRFLSKWTRVKYSGRSYLSLVRSRAYKKHYHLQNTPIVQYGVKITFEHNMIGRLEIGKNVLLAKECFIDYTGNVSIKDNVQIAFGAILQTHYHPNHADWHSEHATIQTSLVIEEGALIGSRAIVMPTCHYIGKHARVGAGSVVTHDVPDFSVVVGSPARVIREQEH